MQNNNESNFKEPQGVTYDYQKNLNAIVLKIFPKYFVVILLIIFIFNPKLLNKDRAKTRKIQDPSIPNKKTIAY